MGAGGDDVRLGLLGLRQAVAEQQLGLEGIHIAQDDHAPISFRWVSDDRRDVYSVSKTFTSVAVGIAQAEGLLELDDPVLSHLPQFADTAAPGVEAGTIRHLLAMTAGIDYRWHDPDVDHPGDPAQDFLATTPVAPAGSWFAYRGTNSYVLGRIIAAVSGSDLRDFLMPRLFGPLGIGNPQWQRCPLGYPMGAVGLMLRTEEIARLGVTLLHDGSWDGRQLIPAEYVQLMHSQTTATGRDQTDNQIYGMHCWNCARDGAWRIGWHVRAIQHHFAAPPRLRLGDCTLRKVDDGHPRRDLDRTGAVHVTCQVRIACESPLQRPSQRRSPGTGPRF